MVYFNVRLRSSEPLDNGKFPVVLQLSWRNGKNNVRRKRIGISCHHTDWDFKNHRIKKGTWGSVKLK